MNRPSKQYQNDMWMQRCFISWTINPISLSLSISMEIENGFEFCEKFDCERFPMDLVRIIELMPKVKSFSGIKFLIPISPRTQRCWSTVLPNHRKMKDDTTTFAKSLALCLISKSTNIDENLNIFCHFKYQSLLKIMNSPRCVLFLFQAYNNNN